MDTLQLFWAILIPTTFIGGLVLLAAVFESRTGRRGIEWIERRRRANARWAEMLTNRTNREE